MKNKGNTLVELLIALLVLSITSTILFTSAKIIKTFHTLEQSHEK